MTFGPIVSSGSDRVLTWAIEEPRNIGCLMV